MVATAPQRARRSQQAALSDRGSAESGPDSVINTPRKLRWTVPSADTSVIQWLDAQADISA